MNNKIHKPGCMANISCLVAHSDGICPGPYGKCTCDSINNAQIASTLGMYNTSLNRTYEESVKGWEKEFDILLKDYFISKESGIGDIKSFIRSLLEQQRKDFKGEIDFLRKEAYGA